MQNKSCLVVLLLLFIIKNVDAQEQNFKDSLESYYEEGNYEKAKFFAEKQLEKTKFLDDENPDYGVALSDLASIYYSTGNYKPAILLNEKSLAIDKKIFGEKDTGYAVKLSNLGNLYCAMGTYVEAEKLELKALEIYVKLNIENSDYATLLNNIAYMYNCINNFGNAKKYYLKALNFRKKISGEESPGYSLILNNLGVLSAATGNFKEAEIYYNQSLEIRKRASIKNLPDYAFSLSNLASLYGYMNKYKEQEPLLLEALEIRKKALGEVHPDYATSLNNLALVFVNQKKYKEADSTFNVVLKIFRIAVGESNPAYAQVLNNIASMNARIGNFTQAKSFYYQALDIYKKKLGEKSSGYAATLSNLARVYIYTSYYDSAQLLLSHALSINEEVIGEKHPEYAKTVLSLSNLFTILGQPEKSERLTNLILNIECENLLTKLEFLSETELIRYLKDRESYFELPYTYLQRYYSSEVLQVTYNTHLILKTISLQNTTDLTKQMEQSKDTSLISNWNNYKSNKSLLNKMLSQPIAKRTINIDSLANITNQQEKELLRSSAAYRNMKEKLNITWKDVRNGLKSNEAAIEFVKFNSLRRTITGADTNYYAAMLVRPTDTVPVFVKLFEEKQLKAALKDFTYKATVNIRGINAGSVAVTSKTNSLYNLLWQPVERYLINTKTIYFAPDGLLHQVAFAAMPYKKNLLLCDKYNLVQVTSTRQVALDNKEQKPSSIALFGGINYNKQQTDTSASVNADPYAYVYQQNRGTNVDSFTFLPNTLREVKAIKKDMDLQKKKVVLLSGANATEAAFRNLSGNASPQVIHFATHGFTLPNDTSSNKKTELSGNTFKVSDNPLLRCGLAMAGGNKGWKGKAGLDEDDGILTGLEISATSLPNTQLAVLSACETGLGQINGSEGVFGLQRAFKMAGVNYIMATLWQVPDKETAEFMDNFYKGWLSGKSIRQSFINTQQVMRKKYDPYYWAAFTLVQ